MDRPEAIVTPIKLLDVVALTSDLPGRVLLRGQVGTIAEILVPGTFEVEFCDDEGRTYGQAALTDGQFMVLSYRPQRTIRARPTGVSLAFLWTFIRGPLGSHDRLHHPSASENRPRMDNLLKAHS